MFDDFLENKKLIATVGASCLAIGLIVGCCCAKKCMYVKQKQEKNTRSRLDSHAISSSNSAFTSVNLTASSQNPKPSAPPFDM